MTKENLLAISEDILTEDDVFYSVKNLTKERSKRKYVDMLELRGRFVERIESLLSEDVSEEYLKEYETNKELHKSFAKYTVEVIEDEGSREFIENYKHNHDMFRNYHYCNVMMGRTAGADNKEKLYLDMLIKTNDTYVRYELLNEINKELDNTVVLSKEETDLRVKEAGIKGILNECDKTFNNILNLDTDKMSLDELRKATVIEELTLLSIVIGLAEYRKLEGLIAREDESYMSYEEMYINFKETIGNKNVGELDVNKLINSVLESCVNNVETNLILEVIQDRNERFQK